MVSLLRNVFIQALGVGAFFYLLLMATNWIIIFALRALESFSRWYRFVASPYALQIALGLALIYLLVMGVTSSRRD